MIATAVQVTSRLTQAALADPSGTSPDALLGLTNGSGRPTSWQDLAAELGRLGGTVGDLLRRLTGGQVADSTQLGCLLAPRPIAPHPSFLRLPLGWVVLIALTRTPSAAHTAPAVHRVAPALDPDERLERQRLAAVSTGTLQP